METMTSHHIQFGAAVDLFLQPMLEFIEERQPECVVFWLDSEEYEPDGGSGLDPAAFRHHVTAAMYQGYYVTIQGEHFDGADRIVVAIWEEWDGFSGPRWAPIAGVPLFQYSWSGYQSV